MRNNFDIQLETLHKNMIHMGNLCVEAISTAISSLSENDKNLIDKVFDTDHEIDQMERDIEALCMKLILHQQPVASDLRKISSALKMISDMERIGDQASDIAEIAQYVVVVEETGNSKEYIKNMAAEAVKMVSESIASFVRNDLELARNVIGYDDTVDRWFYKIKKELVALVSEDNSKGEYYIDLLMIAKYLERIGDHATNISEWVEYSITGLRSKDGVILDMYEK
ncbi:MAG: phosphate signaling complex protein PhoU [Bacillota bacterium]|nr:phosphate signaling complex protein PhoU [Bacillota bacterium]